MLLIKLLLVLCSAVVVMAKSTSVISGAAFVGVDTTQARASAADIYAKPVNHATAMSSLIAFAAKTTDFIPSQVPLKDLSAKYDRFVTKVSTFPGFNLVMSEQYAFLLTGSLTKFEENIRTMVPDHGSLVGRGLRDLFPEYIPDKDMNSWLLTFLLMEKPQGSDQVCFELFSLTVTIEMGKHHTAHIPKQEIALNRVKFAVNSDMLIANAESLGEKIGVTSVDGTIDLVSSPKSFSEYDMTAYHGDSLRKVRQQGQAILAWIK